MAKTDRPNPLRERLAQEQASRSRSSFPTSTTGDGGDNYDDMISEFIDAKIAAAEARTDAKFEALRGDLKGIAASTSGLKTTVLGTGIAVVAIVIAVLAYGGDRFGAGSDISGIIERAATRAVEQALPRQELGTVNAQPPQVPADQ